MATKRIRIGKLPPRFSFALNQYIQTRWSRCPKCGKLTYMRKFPLLIHVDGFGLLNLGKTCRYCATCEFIIAHQNDLEHILTEIFSESYPAVIGNEYQVIGTVETKTWREGMIEPSTIEFILEHTADIKEYLTLRYEPRGWLPPDPVAPARPGNPNKKHRHR